jgi:hypothetical protein
MRELYWEVSTHYCQAPITDSFKRAKQAEAQKGRQRTYTRMDVDGDRLADEPYTEAENEPPRPEDGDMTFL